MANATLSPGFNALRKVIQELLPEVTAGDTGLGPNAFITTGTPLYAAWAPQEDAQPANPWGGGGGSDTSATAYDPVKAFNDIVDYIPQVAYVYRPSAMTVTQAYGFILDNLRVSTAQDTTGLDALYKQQSALAIDINKARSAMWNAYLASPQYPSVPFESYISTAPEFQLYQNKVGQMQRLTLQIREKLGPGGAVASAITEFDALINPATAPKVINPWRWGDMDVVGMITNWRQGVGLNPQQIKAAAKATDAAQSHYIDQSGGGGIPFLGSGGDGSSTETQQIDKSSEEIGLDIVVKAWAQIPVVINDVNTGNKKWYDATVLRAYNQDQYFTAPISGAESGLDPAYGPKGLYPWRIASVIVAFQPTVTISMGSSTYSQFDSIYKSQKSWSAGPFGIFGHHSHTTVKETHTVSTDDKSRSVTIENTNQNPVILGMTMEAVP